MKIFACWYQKDILSECINADAMAFKGLAFAVFLLVFRGAFGD